MRPRSTTLTGISGSKTVFNSSHTSCSLKGFCSAAAGASGHGQAERVGIAGVDAIHGAVLAAADGVAAAQRLQNADRTSGRKRGARAGGNLDDFGVATQLDDDAHGHNRIYSVETASCLPSSAACSVCHASVAHFTRTGNSDTPANTASLPSASGLPSPWPVTRL